VNPRRELQVFYGGTFDPVHNGHVAIACAARDACATGVRMLPAADPPHRPPPGASAPDRAAMIALAIAGVPGLLLDLRELERAGPSWTFDTLTALRAAMGTDVPIAWLVGADSLVGLPTWKAWRGLFALAHFIVADRSGSLLDSGLAPALEEALDGRWTDDADNLRESPAGLVLRLHQPLQAHSATDLRQRIADGLPWQDLVAPAVGDYIRDHRLYGAGTTAAVIGPPPGASL
jgi:nicotinate-nucleotide adenylyltransferase